MPYTNPRYWTIPLAALLFVNTVLVALAARHVGLPGEPRESFTAISPDIPPTQTLASDIGRAPPAEAEPPHTESAITADPYATTEDWPTAGDPITEAVIVPPVAVAEPKVTDPPSQQLPEIPRDVLIVINPPTTGGVVHFLLDGKVISLAPGELVRATKQRTRLVRFHRGDDFGDDELREETGAFVFAVSDRGWTLAEAEDPVVARLLQICRPVAPDTAALDVSSDQDDF